MRIKKENGLAGVDMVIAILAVMIFSTLIISMIYNNIVENVKVKKETLAMIYLTEIFEKVGIESYDNITQSNIGNLVPEDAKENFNVELVVTNTFSGVTNNEDIMKKVRATLTYEVNGKNYSCSMERMKIKE